MSLIDPCLLFQQHCKRVGSKASTTVLRALATESNAMRARGDAAAFPVLSFLRAGGAPHVRTLDLGGSRLSPETLSQLASLLCDQRSCDAQIELLLLRKVRMDDAGLALLLRALCVAGAKSPLRELVLRGNRVTIASSAPLAAALSIEGRNGGINLLRKLDLSNNSLDHTGVTVIEKVVRARGDGLELIIDGNVILAEILNAVTHGIGIIGAISAGAVLAYKSSDVLHVYQTIAIMLFCASLCTMFFFSCMYHSLFRYPPLRDVMHSCDLCSIFVLIAGS
jgi:Haemolysin-III related